MSNPTFSLYFVDLDVQLLELADLRAVRELELAAVMASPPLQLDAELSVFDATAGRAGFALFKRLDLRLIAIAARTAYQTWGRDRLRAFKLARSALERNGLIAPASSWGPSWSNLTLWDLFNLEPYSTPRAIRSRADQLVDLDARAGDAFDAVRYAAARLRGHA